MEETGQKPIDPEVNLTPDELSLLRGKWDGPHGACFNACAEYLLDTGLMDIFGFVTDKGHRVLSEYEKESENSS